MSGVIGPWANLPRPLIGPPANLRSALGAPPLSRLAPGSYADRQSRFNLRRLRRDGAYLGDLTTILLWMGDGYGNGYGNGNGCVCAGEYNP